jgi:hypothetical protein
MLSVLAMGVDLEGAQFGREQFDLFEDVNADVLRQIFDAGKLCLRFIAQAFDLWNIPNHR